MEKIAFLGLGRMGLPMARRLASGGYPLTVWNRTPGRVPEPVEGSVEGLVEVADPAAAVRGAGVVVTMLADPAALAAVARQIVAELAPGTVWVDMSSVGPAAVAEARAQLPDGVGLVDAPVLGSVGPAGTGGLTVLVGGGPEDVERVRPVLERLGRVVDCGGPGAGAALKLVAIGAIVGGVAVVAEALALAGSLGLPEELAEGVLAAGPLGGLVARARAVDADFPVRLAAKDLALAGGGPVLGAVRERLLAQPELAEQDLARWVDAVRAGG
ncbi:NAD(P)-dependent oxidoreductase [Kitasatospora purpeofusca]|uniref:NAD(P)-dependent oxidoreductase n=1 Tax=Kitasatospora purpeofusca TaxID=67352 RepID=UPI002253726A|nr:NAD(P)-binding domain-containing protein [Kitasatospora purpeofusca]MCX4759335.1 NAD(P)-binding domain-containing protein [Kitasatospora purpeofusca]WSR30272.1 NAD(P)-binding domain-containing protein [Kitasatospora purpeofusca]